MYGIKEDTNVGGYYVTSVPKRILINFRAIHGDKTFKMGPV